MRSDWPAAALQLNIGKHRQGRTQRIVQAIKDGATLGAVMATEHGLSQAEVYEIARIYGLTVRRPDERRR